LQARYWFAATLILIGVTAKAGSAQNRALILLAHGAYQMTAGNLNDQGDDLSAGWVGGGGLALQISSSLALRGSASVGRGVLHSVSPGLDGMALHRTVVSVDLQAGVPTTSGWTPYALAGAGFVHVNPQGESTEAFTSFAPHFAAGTVYVMDNRFLSLFWEIGGILYDFDALGYSSYQFDFELRAGLAYAIPF